MTKANDENEYNTLKQRLEERIEEVRQEETRKKDEELGNAKKLTDEQRLREVSEKEAQIKALEKMVKRHEEKHTEVKA